MPAAGPALKTYSPCRRREAGGLNSAAKHTHYHTLPRRQNPLRLPRRADPPATLPYHENSYYAVTKTRLCCHTAYWLPESWVVNGHACEDVFFLPPHLHTTGPNYWYLCLTCLPVCMPPACLCYCLPAVMGPSQTERGTLQAATCSQVETANSSMPAWEEPGPSWAQPLPIWCVPCHFLYLCNGRLIYNTTQEVMTFLIVPVWTCQQRH